MMARGTPISGNVHLGILVQGTNRDKLLEGYSFEMCFKMLYMKTQKMELSTCVVRGGPWNPEVI